MGSFREKTMSRRNSDADDQSKPAMDLYVSLMFVALFAIIFGCVFLVLTLQKYDWTAA